MKTKNKFSLGDIIFVKENVYYRGSYLYKSFFIPEKIIRVTKTQFTTESGKRFNQSGRGIGHSYFAYTDKEDQSNEKKMFEKQVKLANQIYTKLYNLSSVELSLFDLDKLESLDNHLNEFL